MKRSVWVVAVVVFALALGFRLPKLGNRPFHADEAVHAVKFRELWEKGTYRYDPNEFHGPTIYYAALPSVAASGQTTFGQLEEADFRRAIALVGAAIAPFLLFLRKRLGGASTLWAGLFFALSPAFVFYSRYFIQEVFLVTFTVLFLAFAERKQFALVGLMAGLMLATKETAALSFSAAAVAWLVARSSVKNLPWRGLCLGVSLALISSYTILSGFFTNLAGPLGYFKTFTPWLQRAGGGGEALHAHPWYDYLERYFWHPVPGKALWTEGFLLLLALVGAVHCWRTPHGRFLTVFSLLLTLGYTVIPYKTPWCGLNFLAPVIVLAGMGAAGVFERVRGIGGKVIAMLGLLVGSVHLGWLSYQTSFVHFNDHHNPYVYSATLPDTITLKRLIDGIAESSPAGNKMVVKIVARDGYYWPLPWYLRKLDNVGYYVGALPDDPTAPVLLASPRYEEALHEALPHHKILGLHGLRLGVFYELFVQKDLWESYRKIYPAGDDEED